MSTLDGAAGNSTAPEAGKFHLYDFVPSNQSRDVLVWDKPIYPDSIAQVHGSAKANTTTWGFDYDIEWEDRGGILIAEQLAFNRMLTSKEAKYVTNLLKHKWYGAADPGALTNTVLDSVSVAAGASLVLRVPEAVDFNGTKALAGEGQITTSELKVSDSLDATIGAGKTSCLTVVGTVVFDGSLTVNVTVDTTLGRLRPGRYPILSASALEGVEETKFTVCAATVDPRLENACVVRDGNTLYLEIRRRGLVVYLH